MLKFYKLEIFSPFIALIIVLLLDIASAPDFTFFDYSDLQGTCLEDILLFIFASTLMSIIIMLIFHVYRIVKLRNFTNKKLQQTRIILLISNVSYLLIFILIFNYSENSSSFYDNIMMLVSGVIALGLLITSIIYLLNEFQILKTITNKDNVLIDELHH